MSNMPKEAKAHNLRSSPATNAAGGGGSATRTASTWSPADDEILMNARASGLNWQPIATKYFPSKTANACRKRHERLMERRNAEDWDGIKLEKLAREYMEVRREMWSILGSRLGEKWTLVEAKCMEKGLKNLQAAHRSAQRKRGIYYEADSGIDCSDAENEIDEGSTEVSPASQHHQQQQGAQGGYTTHQRGPSIQSMLSPIPGSSSSQNQA